MTGLLASVRDLREARLARAGGADIIDLKEPAAGALGAVALPTLRRVRAALPDALLSATIGDQPMQPQPLLQAVAATAATGVDYVKVGFFAGGDWAGCLQALGGITGRTAVVAVLFADQGPDPALLDALRAAGLRGAMLDTADKRRRLTELLDPGRLRAFVGRCRALGLLCGLAGSLRRQDIEPLLPLAPDYLGFRGALCDGDRRGRLDPQALAAVRRCIPRYSAAAALA